MAAPGSQRGFHPAPNRAHYSLALTSRVIAMCLAVPGKILNLEGDDPLLVSGKVDFGGIVKQVNLAFVPEAGIGDYVLVHAGFAISVIDQEQASEVWDFLEKMDGMDASRAGGPK